MPITMTDNDRNSHMHIVGGSGTGKSNLIYNLITQDIKNGNGLCMIDPHGELYSMVGSWLASNRTLYKRRKIHLIDITENRIAAAFNPLANDGSDLSVIANNNTEAISTAWKEDSYQTPRLKEVLEQTFISLISRNMTYLDSPLFLNVGLRDERRRIQGLPNEAFWDDLDRLNDRAFKEETDSARRRMGAILKNKLLRLMLGQNGHNVDLHQCMEQGDVILVNLAQGPYFSVEQARFLGSLFIRSLVTATYQREAGKASPYYLYIDEAQNFLNEDISEILTQCRKFGLRMILANQDLAQLKAESDVLYDGIMGSAQTKAYFGALGFEDAEAMAKNIFKRSNFKELKHTLTSPSVVGHHRDKFRNKSKSETVANNRAISVANTQSTSSSQSKATSTGKSKNSGNSQITSDSQTSGEIFLPVDEHAMTLLPVDPIQTRASESRGSNVGTSSSSSEGRFLSNSESVSDSQSEAISKINTQSQNRGSGKSAGYSEGLVPIIEERVTSQTFYSLNEQDRKNIERLRTLGLGEFYFSSFNRVHPVKIKADYDPPSKRNKDIRELNLFCAKRSYFIKSAENIYARMKAKSQANHSNHTAELADEDFLE